MGNLAVKQVTLDMNEDAVLSVTANTGVVS